MPFVVGFGSVAGCRWIGAKEEGVSLRIDFARAKSVLESENRGLDTQMGRCVEHADLRYVNDDEMHKAGSTAHLAIKKLRLH